MKAMSPGSRLVTVFVVVGSPLLRIVHNVIPVNRYTIKSAYPMHHLEEVKATLIKPNFMLSGLQGARNGHSNSERECYAMVKCPAQVSWLLLGSKTHNSTTHFSCVEMSWHLTFSGHGAFVAMIVCIVTLVATIRGRRS